jgi:hypothetical protein
MRFNNILLQPIFLLLALIILSSTTLTPAVSIGLSSAIPILTRTFHKRQGHIFDPNNDGLEVKVVFIRDLSKSADKGCHLNSFGHKICHLSRRGIEPLEDEQAEEEEEETEIEEAALVKHHPPPYWLTRQVNAPLIMKRDFPTTTTTPVDDRPKRKQRPIELLNRRRRISVPFHRDMYFVQRRRDVLTFMPDELEKESEVEEEQEEDEDEDEDDDEEEEDEYEREGGV